MNKKKFANKEGQSFIFRDVKGEVQCKLIYVDPRPLSKHIFAYLVEFPPTHSKLPFGCFTHKQMLEKQKRSTFWGIRKHAEHDDGKEDIIDSLKFNPECEYYWAHEDELSFTEMGNFINEINKELNEST